MLRVFIIKLFLCVTICLRAQEGFNDSLLKYEYRYFTSTNETVKQDLLLQKINLYLQAGVTNSLVFNEIKRIKSDALGTQQLNFLWNAALISYLNNEKDYARFFLSRYESLSPDSSVTTALVKILVYKFTDTTLTRKLIKNLAKHDSLFNDLSCFETLISYNRKNLKLYLLSSAILPGSGTVMNGYVAKGLLSLAIISSSAYAIVKMVEYGLYINAVLWGTGVGLKFYAGNINLTQQSFYKAETKQKNKLTNDCELKLKMVLDKYPLTLRLK